MVIFPVITTDFEKKKASKYCSRAGPSISGSEENQQGIESFKLSSAADDLRQRGE
jgi:hypothetical protein